MRRRSRGQAMVEFALVLALFVVLGVGAVQSLYALYLTRHVRAAAEEIADLAAVYGGDTPAVRQRISLVLSHHRLDPERAEVEILPETAPYLTELQITLRYGKVVRIYGLFDLPIPPQAVLRLSEGG